MYHTHEEGGGGGWEITLSDDHVEIVYEEKVTRFGHGAKIGCPREVPR
jgi:hypothetical protein